VLLADRCIESGLRLPEFAAATTEELKKTLVSYASSANPVDATANGYNDAFASYGKAVELVLNDPNIDQLIVRTPRGKSSRVWSENLLRLLRGSSKPCIVDWPTSPDDNGDVIEYLEENGVPCIVGSGRAARAAAALTEFSDKCRAYRKRAGKTLQRGIASQALDLPVAPRRSESTARSRCWRNTACRWSAGSSCRPAEIEALQASPFQFPVAVKIESPDVPHKTEAGAVKLGISDLAGLKQAARDVVAAAQRYKPGARIDGVLVQEMASGVEVIAGVVNDPSFGPIVTFGLGGIFTELMKDVTHRFAPFGVDEAREMIGEIRGAAMLTGYRGRPALDVNALADALARLSLLAADHADRIAEIDVNPLFVRDEGVVAADALIVKGEKA
jgi:acyl-CoA synthetase (NDP forming)